MDLVNLNSQGQRLLAMIQETHPNYHPILSMADVACDEDADPGMRFAAHKEIAQYIEPKLKSVEVRGTITESHGRLPVVFENAAGEIVGELDPPQSMYPALIEAIPEEKVEELLELGEAEVHKLVEGI